MQHEERMNTELMLNTHEADDGRTGRKFRDGENERVKGRNSVRVHVFHFKLSTPHFHEVGNTFDFDTGTALKEFEMFFSLSRNVSSHVQLKARF